jgi:hypothetical protein
MVVGRAARRAARAAQVEAVLGKAHAPAALDLLELAEFAWHDCYGERPLRPMMLLMTSSSAHAATWPGRSG